MTLLVKRDEFYDALARSGLVALAGTEHVSAYTRTSKTGKTVHVGAYTRSPGDMSNTELFKEYSDLRSGKADIPQTAQRSRLGAITSEIRKRKSEGKWGSAASGEKRNPLDMRGAAAAPNPGNNWNGKGKPESDIKFESTAQDAAKADTKADAEPEDKPEWEPGAEFATNKFLDEKHHKQSGEEGGVYTPTREEQAEWEARIEEVLSAPLDEDTIKDLTAGPSTADNHLERNADGGLTFSKERQALHKRIIAAFLDGYTPQEKPRYHMMGGGPASGKSAMERDNPEISSGHAVINADEVKGMLPEAWMKDGTLNSGLAHEESSHVTKMIQKEAFARRLGVTLDGTGDGGARGVRKKLKQARDNGYEVHGYYVSTDVESAIKRAKQRASKPPYRAVPEELLRDTHADVSRTFKEVADEFDSVKLYDSTSREGVLTGEKKPGGRFEVQDSDAWKKFLDKANTN